MALWCKKGLTTEASKQGRGETIAYVKDGLIFNPDVPAGTKWDLMDNALSDAQHRQLAMKPRIAATAEKPSASDKRRRESILTQMNPRNGSELADMIAGGSVESTQSGKVSADAAQEVGLEDAETSEGGTRNKMADVAARASSLEDILRFEAMTGRANVTRSCDLSLKSVASGIRYWGNFC